MNLLDDDHARSPYLVPSPAVNTGIPLAFEYKQNRGTMAVFLAAALEILLEVSNNKCVNLRRLNVRAKSYGGGYLGKLCD